MSYVSLQELPGGDLRTRSVCNSTLMLWYKFCDKQNKNFVNSRELKRKVVFETETIRKLDEI
jgi:hypothetical protein